MKDLVEERAAMLGEFIVKNEATVRATAKAFGISKSTVHMDVAERLKKVNSILHQSLIIIANHTGYPLGDYTFMKNDEFFNYFATNVLEAKDCTFGQRGCFSADIKQLDGKFWANYDGDKAIVAADGTAYSWKKDSCGTNKGISKEDEKNCLGRFIVDVNGSQNPNRFGYDIFFFMVVNGKGIVPAGSANNSADCKKGQNGITCAAKVIKEGKITYL